MGLLLDDLKRKNKKRNYKAERRLKEIEDELEIIKVHIISPVSVWLLLSGNYEVTMTIIKNGWIITRLIKNGQYNDEDEVMWVGSGGTKINTIKELRELIYRL